MPSSKWQWRYIAVYGFGLSKNIDCFTTAGRYLGTSKELGVNYDWRVVAGGG